MSEQAKVNLSRRSFLARAGAVTTGAMASGSVVAALAAPSRAEAATPPAAGSAWRIPTDAAAYLDFTTVRNNGYWGYWENDPQRNTNFGCAYGVAKALITELKRLMPGSAWETLPLEMFKWGKTGCVESGTLCGALAGAMPIFTLMAPEKNVEMGMDLIRWYEETALPTTAWDAPGALYDPKHNYPNQPSSRSNSPLCHVSVSSWCKVANQTADSTQRKTRCGKLSGDVANKALEIIQSYVANGYRYTPLYTQNPPEYADCVHCHVDKPTNPIPPDQVRLNNALGTSDCKTCHPDAAPVMSKKK